jgi:methylmalonyl-CoA mutase
MVVVGGVIPAQDYQFYLMPVWLPYLDRNKISEAAIKILEILMGSFE